MSILQNINSESYKYNTTVTTVAETVSGVTKSDAKINSTMNETGKTVAPPVDAFSASANSAVSQKVSERSAKEIYQSISVLCQKYSLDINKLKTGIENITGLVSDDDKKKLTEKQQAVLLSIVENSIQKAASFKENKNNSIDIVEAVLVDALITTEIIVKKKTFKDLKSLDNDVQENAKEFIDALKDIESVEDFEASQANFEAHMKEKYEKEKEAINKLPKDQRAAAIERLKEKHAAIRARLLTHNIYLSCKKDVSANALAIANSKDTGRLTTGLYKMQPSDKARQELAVKYHSFGLDEKILNAQKARGDEFNKESWQEYVKVNASWKDEKSLIKYHTDVLTAVSEGKLAKEVFKATTKGIGFGARINHVMSGEEKSQFIEKWTTDIKNYYGENSDEYKEIKAYVEQKVEEYNKAQLEKQAEAKTEKQTEFAKQTNETSKPNQDVQTAQLLQQKIRYADRIELTKKTNKDGFAAVYKSSESELTEKKSEVREKILSKELTSNTEIKEALGVGSERNVIEFIGKDPLLRVLEKNRIADYVRKQDVNSGNLQALATNVPVIIDIIMNNMRGNKEEFAQDLIRMKKVGFCETKRLEKETQDVV